MPHFRFPAKPKDLANGIRAAAAQISRMVFPDRCLDCGRYILDPSGQGLARCFCPGCGDRPLSVFQPPFCPCCGHLFAVREQENHLCQSCMTEPPAIGRVRAAYAFEGQVRTAVSRLKYTGRMKVATHLGQDLYRAFERYWEPGEIDVIVPVPLHRTRVWKRGFNQAVLLVRDFSALYKKMHGHDPPWQIELKALARIRPTQRQTGLNQADREMNLNQAFGIRGDHPFRGRQVLLVDDVYTSGATSRSAAKTLLRAGAARVDVLVVARA